MLVILLCLMFDDVWWADAHYGKTDHNGTMNGITLS